MKEIEVGFDNLKELTIGKIKELAEQVKKLEEENKLLKIKYPTKKVNQDPHGTKGAQDIIDALPK
jgi:hypothetical protein